MICHRAHECLHWYGMTKISVVVLHSFIFCRHSYYLSMKKTNLYWLLSGTLGSWHLPMWMHRVLGSYEQTYWPVNCKMASSHCPVTSREYNNMRTSSQRVPKHFSKTHYYLQYKKVGFYITRSHLLWAQREDWCMAPPPPPPLS